MKLDSMTLDPMDRPLKKVTITLITGALVPTAAIAWLDEKFPTTAVSEALNSCCRMLDRQIGIAIAQSLRKILPLNIFISLLFFISDPEVFKAHSSCCFVPPALIFRSTDFKCCLSDCGKRIT